MPAVNERRARGPRHVLGNTDWMISFRKSSSGIDGFLGDGTPIPKGDVERALSPGELLIGASRKHIQSDWHCINTLSSIFHEMGESFNLGKRD